MNAANTKPITAAIVGAAGYAGAELAALLAAHPHIQKVFYVSRTRAGEKVSDMSPSVRGDAVFQAPDSDLYKKCDTVFYATPHAVAMHEAELLLAQNIVVIDLSPDFRLRDAAVFEQWYGVHSSPHLLAQAVYGLSEAARPQLLDASLIACPGCNATAVELALIPLAAANVLCGQVIADIKAGVSGAGRRTDRLDLLYVEQADNFKVYAEGGHRHQPEIEQAIAEFGYARASAKSAKLQLLFMPHLLPAPRGVYANLYVPVKRGTDCAALLRAHWQDATFVECLDSPPQLAQVVRTNRACLYARQVNEDTAMIICALDNLQKGAAGQAVQNMNIRFGFAEDAGLLGARM